MARTKAKAESQVAEVVLELPIGEPPLDGYEERQAGAGKISLAPRRSRLHVQAQLGHDAAVTLIRIRNGLRQQHATLNDGRPVWTNVDAFRWIVEQVAGQLS